MNSVLRSHLSTDHAKGILNYEHSDNFILKICPDYKIKYRAA